MKRNIFNAVLNGAIIVAALIVFTEWQKDAPDKSEIVCRMSAGELAKAKKELQRKINANLGSVNDCEMLDAYGRALKRIQLARDDTDDATSQPSTSITFTITNASSITQWVEFPIQSRFKAWITNQ